MKILFYTQYYPPETGAPQNRLHELALRLKNLGIEVEVLTAMPNYPQMKVYRNYRGKWFTRETLQGVTIYRAFIYASKGRSIVPRLLNYFSFVFSSFIRGTFLKKRYDYILCESPPLFLGMGAVALSRIRGWKLIFNVSDLWPESAEKLGIVSNQTLLGLAYRLEKWCYKNSILVSGQTRGIVNDIAARFPETRVFWLPNGVDTEAYNPVLFNRSWRTDKGFSDNDTLFLYAGILGHAQKLETILLAADRLRAHPAVHFIILGEGPEKEHLLAIKRERDLQQVHFFPGIPKEQMGYVISSVDAAIIPLRRLDLFKGAIPSKIFETLAMEKPILLGVDGEARELFIDEGKAGWYFEPENDEQLSNTILNVVLHKDQMWQAGRNGRLYVQSRFNRDNIALEFKKTLVSLSN